MRRSPILAALALLFAAPAAAQAPASAPVVAPPPPPPLVVHNARVYTVDDRQPVAEAFAVVDGRFAAVGSNAFVLGRFPNAARVDAGGRAVVPGLIDAHAHLTNLGEALTTADLAGSTSKADVLARLRAFERTGGPRNGPLPDGAWLVGRGWDQNDWSAGSGGARPFPTRADLDAAFPDRPVFLTRIDGHAAWANTAALRAAGGLERVGALRDPTGGRIVRDERGVPTGVFVDAAMAVVESRIPSASGAQADLALTRALAETARFGLTGVHEAGVDAATVARYERRIAAGTFPVRLYAMIGGRGPTFDRYCGQARALNTADQLAVRSVKFYLDGALGSRGAALLAPYADDAGNVGLLFQEPDAFEADVRAAVACGYQVNTHAIGDRANRVALDAYAAAGDRAGRHRVEHAQIIAPADIPRFGALGVIASVQPTHATSDLPWAGERVGETRLRGAYAWRSLLDGGARLALGSDFPVERVDPLLGFYAAVTRRGADGVPAEGWSPEQRLTRAEALRGFTLDAAYAAFMEDRVGSITSGKLADFVLLSEDIMEIEPARLLQAKVVATYLGGRKVYGE